MIACLSKQYPEDFSYLRIIGRIEWNEAFMEVCYGIFTTGLVYYYCSETRGEINNYLSNMLSLGNTWLVLIESRVTRVL